MTAELSPMRFDASGLHLLDQRRLPGREVWLSFDDMEGAAGAIENMVVRGAPAIGCTAAYGVALAARELAARGVRGDALARGLADADARLRRTRPTAVHLFWALDDMREATRRALAGGQAGDAIADALARRAMALQAEDIETCRRIGRAGAQLMPDGGRVLTHCNAGALATGGYGTALGVLRAAREAGKRFTVVADETRPYLQGARLTAWELLRDGFDVEVIPDSAAGLLMARGEIDAVIVGADRIARNGDTANKIGTYPVALAAAAHEVPFYVAAPLATVDDNAVTGADIPIEERNGAELYAALREPTAPDAARLRYPGFDITPAALITAIVTECGIIPAPFQDLKETATRAGTAKALLSSSRL